MRIQSSGFINLNVVHPTTYLETLMHLLKGNIGTGLFAMGDAYKNAGIAMAPWLIISLGIVCVHCEHLLLNCSMRIKDQLELDKQPDYAETVELCFALGPQRFQKISGFMKILVNWFLCITHLGFCCVNFMFISVNIKQVLDHHGIILNIHLHMLIILFPIILTCMVKNLKFLAPLSIVANFLMLIGVIISFYYACQDLPPISSVPAVANLRQFPLFLGTVLFSFEGIGLILPLQSEMKKPKEFISTYGVLNVGMTVVVSLYVAFGFISYLKFGDKIHGSVTVNLPNDKLLSQIAKVIISIAILLTYPLHFYVPSEIVWEIIMHHYETIIPLPTRFELLFRAGLVCVTFVIAENIPYLERFISLVGSVAATSLAFLFPPLCQLINLAADNDRSGWGASKDWFLFCFGVFIFVTGSATSIFSIWEEEHEVEKHRMFTTFISR